VLLEESLGNRAISINKLRKQMSIKIGGTFAWNFHFQTQKKALRLKLWEKVDNLKLLSSTIKIFGGTPVII